MSTTEPSSSQEMRNKKLKKLFVSSGSIPLGEVVRDKDRIRELIINPELPKGIILCPFVRKDMTIICEGNSQSFTLTLACQSRLGRLCSEAVGWAEN